VIRGYVEMHHPASMLGADQEDEQHLGNLARFASCERAAEAGRRGGKLSRVRFSQPLGSVMTGRRELDGKRSECNEVKGVCPESEP